MKPLPFQENRHLEAAQAWLVLSNFLEANAELENMDPTAWDVPTRRGWCVAAVRKRAAGSGAPRRSATSCTTLNRYGSEDPDYKDWPEGVAGRGPSRSPVEPIPARRKQAGITSNLRWSA